MMHEHKQVKKLKPECLDVTVPFWLNAVLTVQALDFFSVTQMQRVLIIL